MQYGLFWLIAPIAGEGYAHKKQAISERLSSPDSLFYIWMMKYHCSHA